ncbi:fatty acid-binding protein, heart [Papilio machaon]|uniref:fatty acid-binding protein, heart n=1 Tax=Papilio machaon TaxID=76193 RepID=UPI001E662FB1|nr:fatty acid-binding protein, heart [Papilio machaon]
MEEFLGVKYVMVGYENFEDYLIFIGVGYIARKAALTLRPTHCLTLNENGTYTFSFNSRLVNSSVTFALGIEFDEVKPDGVKVKSVITIEGNKMIHIQREENGRTSKHIREFFHDKMIATTTAEGLDKIVKRYFEAVR